MKIVQINVSCGRGSTGRIVSSIAEEANRRGYNTLSCYGRYFIDKGIETIHIGNDLDVKVHGFIARIDDASGFGSKKETKKVLRMIKEYDPDIIHLHNIHGYYINIVELFNYLRESRAAIVWTLHDCWSFTGHCAHFAIEGCNKWKSECNRCPQKHKYPESLLFDRSTRNYRIKEGLFTGIDKMRIITPSEWLACYVKQSYLKDYLIEIIPNGIDVSLFKPSNGSFREEYDLMEKKVILGVAGVWNEQKGLGEFIQLSKMLDDSYRIVLLGVNKKQKRGLPSSIIGIERIEDIQRLAEIYTTADVFVNLSKEETFGMTTIEAGACGTNVIVYQGTACEEVAEKIHGFAVEQNISSVYKKICELTERNDNIEEKERRVRVVREEFSTSQMTNKYMQVYMSLTNR